MIEIKTLFRIKNDFVPIEEFSGSFNDIDYIEGAISLSINNVTILSLNTWDYVDQLWAYIINGLEDIILGKNYFTYLPDQPIGLSFEIVGNNMVKVSVDYKGCGTAVISKNIFISNMCKNGRIFFNKMLDIVPKYKDSWVKYLNKIEKIEKDGVTS